MNAVADVQVAQPEKLHQVTSREAVKIITFWLAGPPILVLLVAFYYALLATTFNWPGQNLFPSWTLRLVSWMAGLWG
jgi:hypothetical protein